ncbi:hypothetical protein BDEG_24542 [Batrachochytrium dendrobatidis JEL423]|uniref:Uncharacterized protein n=1 Tax=Batrachochytrium dendrobatidis (strain JEL423) TaxID=403673 RepID=A0A177WL66_BATDL|nr:hypothetical protein BDEG_24542 [Batrachochytrium dendrobatidis JEL423]
MKSGTFALISILAISAHAELVSTNTIIDNDFRLQKRQVRKLVSFFNNKPGGSGTKPSFPKKGPVNGPIKSVKSTPNGPVSIGTKARTSGKKSPIAPKPSLGPGNKSPTPQSNGTPQQKPPIAPKPSLGPAPKPSLGPAPKPSLGPGNKSPTPQSNGTPPQKPPIAPKPQWI